MKWKTAKNIVFFFDKPIIIEIDEEDQSAIYEVGDDIDKMKYTFNSVGILVKIRLIQLEYWLNYFKYFKPSLVIS